jgi:DNA-binding CsgD family transcriptional regulator
MRQLSVEALAHARTSGDDAALLDALRARQEANPGPHGRGERASAAAETITIAQRHGDARSEMWGRLWEVDTLVEQGRLGDAAGRLERLAEAARRVGGPVSAWLVDRCTACIAQGRGDLDAASAAGERAYERMRAIEPEAAFGAYLAISCAIAHHRPPDAGARALASAPFSAPALFTHMRRTGRAFLLARGGLLDAATAEYELAGPPAGWAFPPFYVLPGLVVGGRTAAELGRDDDVRTLLARLEPFRGQHVVGGAGVVVYLGPVELHLGACSLRVGDVQTAIDDLTSAEIYAEHGGATSFVAEARHLLARALLARDEPGDAARAAGLAHSSARTIRALGLDALADASTLLLERVEASVPSLVLTDREQEVAMLVSRGLTNRQIAERLVISTRTAQNHVQNILTKLGFSSRSQIASWKAARRNE